MDFIGTKKKTGDNRKTQPLAFVKVVVHGPRSRMMTMAEIEQKAKLLGIQTDQMDIVVLIRSIQMAEGNNPCFKTSNCLCIHTDCCFMANCMKV
jgi:hypothetical protein